MQAFPKLVKTGALVLTLAATLAAQQGATGQVPTSHDAALQQGQGNAAGSRTGDQQAAEAADSTNPGFGAQDPNLELSGGQPQTMLRSRRIATGIKALRLDG
jgi:hypothetical protein